MDMLRLFYDWDEFCREFVPHLQTYQIAEGEKPRLRHSTLRVSEVMTILILFHTSGFRTLKTFSLHHICLHLTLAFPQRVSYSRFVELEAQALLPLAAFLTTRLGRCTGLSFIDSTPLKVCHNLRIKSHKVFKEIAQRGVSSTGWFSGCKVHLVISDCGELLAVRFTPGNVDARKPVPKLARRLCGNLIGDRGYISQALFSQLWGQGVQLLTKLKKKRQPRVLPLLDKMKPARKWVGGSRAPKHSASSGVYGYQPQPHLPRRIAYDSGTGQRILCGPASPPTTGSSTDLLRPGLPAAGGGGGGAADLQVLGAVYPLDQRCRVAPTAGV